MIIKFLDCIKNLDIKIHKIMKNGLYFSLAISIISACFLIYYLYFYPSNYVYYIGIEIMHLAISFAVYFFSSAIAFDTIKKDFS